MFGMSKRKSDKWFIKVRGSYLPNNWKGWLTYIPYAAYVLGIVVYVTMNNFDRLLAVFLVVPNWVAALAVMTWLARSKS